MRRASLIVVSLSLFSACGGDITPGGINNAGEYLAAIGRAQCEHLARCGDIAKSEQGQCERDTAEYFKALTRGWDPNKAVDDKRIAFDGAAARDCVDSQRKQDCSHPFSTSPRCRAVVRPLIAAGGACTADQECQTGKCTGVPVPGCATGTCAATGCADFTCGEGKYCDPAAGACKDFVAAGGSCSADQECATQQCSDDGKCVAPGKAGEACKGAFVGDTCDNGFYCDKTTSKCVAKLAAGATCDSPYACGDGLACVGVIDNPTGKCTAYVEIGAACQDLTFSECPASAPCDSVKMTCVSKVVALGGGCAGSNVECTVNAYCDGNTMKCTALSGVGQACAPPPQGGKNPCVNGKCDPQSKVCVSVCM